MTHLVQLRRGDMRAVALCDEPRLRILDGFISVFDLAQKAIATRVPLVDLVRTSTEVESLDYHAVYTGRSAWRLATSSAITCSSGKTTSTSRARSCARARSDRSWSSTRPSTRSPAR